MKVHVMRYLWLFLFLGIGFMISAQSLSDLANLNISQVSDQQLELLIRRANAQGYSSNQLVQLAQVQGMSQDQLALFSQRIQTIRSGRASSGNAQVPERGTRSSPELNPFELESLLNPKDSIKKSRVFGYNFFSKNVNLSFEPNLNQIPPADYRLGPEDEIYIDIYGELEQYYTTKVSASGAILIENVGPIYIAGLTVAQAEKRLVSRFSKLYSSLIGDSPKSFLNLEVGNIRSIRVNVVGEVEVPGTYTLSSLGTVLNALYIAGGIKENGTFRRIKHYRDNQLVSIVDVYDFLVSGQLSSNKRLEDDDVIIVDPYSTRVEVNGAVKRPGIFELNEEETLKDLMTFAGGFNEDAYKELISLSRNGKEEKIITDISKDQFEVIYPKAGDVYEIRQILDRYVNRVQIQGAVLRSGVYSLNSADNLLEIIAVAGGPTGDALLNRGYITRTNLDKSLSTIPFSLKEVLDDPSRNIDLEPEDVVVIVSKLDVSEEETIEVSGQVNNPGVFTYAEGMTVMEAIIRAGGYRSLASSFNIEILRRDYLNNGDVKSNIVLVNINSDFSRGENDIMLKAFDRINIRQRKGDVQLGKASVEGQVDYPGEYPLQSSNDRVSDLLKRAGSIKTQAYLKGATLIRRTEVYKPLTSNQLTIEGLQQILYRLDSNKIELSEAQKLQQVRIIEEIERLQKVDLLDRTDISSEDYERFRLLRRRLLSLDSVAGALSPMQSVQREQILEELGKFDLAEKENDYTTLLKAQRLEELGRRDDLNLFENEQIRKAESIAINIERILNQPGSPDDLILEDGDILVIPKESQTVRIRGSVLYPTTVRHTYGRTAKHYVNLAGGFDERSMRGKSYVVYQNGAVAKTRKLFFLRFYPRVDPGSDIIVPSRPIKTPVRIQDVMAITSGLATLALLVNQLNNRP